MNFLQKHRSTSLNKGQALVLALVFVMTSTAVVLGLATNASIKPNAIRAQLIYAHKKRLAQDAIYYAVRELNALFLNADVYPTETIPTISGNPSSETLLNMTPILPENFIENDLGYGFSGISGAYGYRVRLLHLENFYPNLRLNFTGLNYNSANYSTPRMRYHIFLIESYACNFDTTTGGYPCGSNAVIKEHRLYERVFGSSGEGLTFCLCG